jgi:hypothetical protein
MKKVYTLFSFLLLSGVVAAQESKNVGIGTAKPDNSAVLDINSESKGLLIPRLTSSQKEKIQDPAKGLLIFQTDDSNSGFFFFNGNRWSPLTNGDAHAIATVDANGWALDGNAVANSNKAAATASSFIGTPNGIPINFKIGATSSGKIASNVTLIGHNAGSVVTGNHNTGFGLNALNLTTSSLYNTAIGSNSLGGSNSGGANTAVGYNSLNANTTGSQNAALGINSLRKNKTGSNNLGIGTYALQENLNGANNMAIGTSSLGNLKTGQSNTAIGTLALGDAGLTEVEEGSSLASRNVGVGFNANRRLRIGNDNISIGNSSAFNMLDGSNNISIGSGALVNATNSVGNIAIGYQAAQNESGSNKLYIANSGTPTPLVYGDFSAKFLSIGDVPVAKRDAVASSGQYSLIVEKGILSEKLKVALKSSTDWADYVFEPEYKSNMMSLEEVEKFTLENKHLPNVPSATELVEKGLDFNETSKMFMEKIEELTLYLIELNKEVKALKVENSELKSKLNK